MEIIDEEPGSGEDLVEIVVAETREEAALIRGLLREEGIRSIVQQGSLNGRALRAGPRARRICVRPDDAERGRSMLAETMVEDPLEDEIPEPANAAYLADAAGRRPRDYGLGGFYIRAGLVAVAFFALLLIVFLVLH